MEAGRAMSPARRVMAATPLQKKKRRSGATSASAVCDPPARRMGQDGKGKGKSGDN